MDDTKDAVVQTEVEDTTQTSSPQVEVPSTDEQTIQDKPETQVTDELPADEEERRRAFQEQRLEIKRLKEEKEARVKSESAFDVFRPKSAPVVNNVPVRVEDYRDAYTGEINYDAYNAAMNSRLNQVEQNARFQAQQTVEETLDENKARTQFPELFDDADTEQEIADRWFAAKMRGENPSITDIAKRIAKRVGTAVSKAEKIGAEKVLEEVTPKEQAALAATGETSASSKGQISDAEFDRLRLQSRGRGSEAEDAIVKRLRAVPYSS
jgi:hypothetical protein